MSEEPPGLQGKGWGPQSRAVQGGQGGVTGRLGEGTGRAQSCRAETHQQVAQVWWPRLAPGVLRSLGGSRWLEGHRWRPGLEWPGEASRG